ncbi:MAG: hypothetical protein IJ410_05735 [Oscillospiraceae bacterium]|nr:hypothetical protein [Oscillospiraceae bacterium]
MKRIIGHRGWASLAPENTIHGFKLALEDDRVWAIECDVHLTKDRKIVVAHDPFLGRCCNATGRIADYTYEELLEFDFGGWFGEEFKDTKIMLYSDLLKMIDGKKRLVCEIKSEFGLNNEIVPYILEESKGVPKEMLCFKSFDHRIMKALSDAGCEYDLGLLFMDKPHLMVEELKACGCNFISMLYYNYDQKIFDELKEAGIDCYAWTVDSIENADYMYQFKNHEIAIITNKPQLFWEY